MHVEVGCVELYGGVVSQAVGDNVVGVRVVLIGAGARYSYLYLAREGVVIYVVARVL